ncbi:uncharacterized protein LOC116211693 [Punica granatum]|uniref:DC1 domain-containing protein n=2 Tax=Punica granatum TaxID=22663 RepID=A0A218W9W1_PUNGR|nr:uncharacterized protein LOC116211693 [Punica granatum]OWM69248.1 hypothetical protein CDL15_Pgr025435 [Punica granatum]PKI73603.1 hypothetical protein CRG98_005977 [Punica granatum]
MGMMSTETEQRPVITHFSHPHPLEITSLPEKLQAACSGCGIKIFPGKAYYACKTCEFCLHGTCYNLPRKIYHPADPNHHLILILSPSFRCRGCGNPGNGFSYNCNVCSQDYHSLCTLKPLSITHRSHSHPLILEFAPAYEGKGFRCDLCQNPGGLDHWFYSCSGCGFDVHLDCAKSMTEPLRVQVPLNPAKNYSNRSVPSCDGFGPAGAHVADPAMPITPITTQRGPPTNNTSFPMVASQFSPPGAPFVNQGGFGYASGAPIYGMNTGVPGGNNVFPTGSYVGNNQTVFLRTTNGAPMTTVLQPNGSALSYAHATPMGVAPSQGGMMNGMQGLIIGGVASGIGQQLGQDVVHSLTNGLGGDSGSGSSDSSGLSDIVGCWIGGSDYY